MSTQARINVAPLTPNHDEPTGEREISLLSLANFALRWRRVILGSALGLGIAGLLSGIFAKSQYQSTATFLAQGTEAPSDLSAAAALLGLRAAQAANSGGWGPQMYMAVLQTRSVLEPIALDSVSLPEEGGRRVALMDLFEVKGTGGIRVEKMIERLRTVILPEIGTMPGGMVITVTTQWPSVSLGIAQHVVSGLNQFNLVTRQSQAAAERRFVEAQAVEAEAALRSSEAELLTFLNRNRNYEASPQLSVMEGRFQREVTLRQQIYTSLLQNREQARIREVRDTPVITVVDAPRMPLHSLPSPAKKRALFGFALGILLGGLAAAVLNAASRMSASSSVEAQEFLELARRATPRVIKRAWR